MYVQCMLSLSSNANLNEIKFWLPTYFLFNTHAFITFVWWCYKCSMVLAVTNHHRQSFSGMLEHFENSLELYFHAPPHTFHSYSTVRKWGALRIPLSSHFFFNVLKIEYLNIYLAISTRRSFCCGSVSYTVTRARIEAEELCAYPIIFL